MDGQEALQALRQSPPTSTTLSDEAQISGPNKSVSSYSPNILMPHILPTSSCHTSISKSLEKAGACLKFFSHHINYSVILLFVYFLDQSYQDFTGGKEALWKVKNKTNILNHCIFSMYLDCIIMYRTCLETNMLRYIRQFDIKQ